MSPIEYIEKGIREGNWEIVCEGYERLTGKSLPAPNIDGALSALERIYDIVAHALVEPETIYTEIKLEETPQKKSRGRPKGSGKKTTKKKVATTKDGEDASLQLNANKRTVVQRETGDTQLITNDPDPEEIAANRIKAARANENKLKLNKRPTKTYDVKCNECEKPFQSNRPQGEIGQKCSNCLKSLKGRFS